jgi:hypothetical protein
VLRPSSLPHALAVLATGLATGPALLLLSTLLTTAPAHAQVAETRDGISGAAGSSTSARATARADDHQPLVPRIRSISPDYVPEHGPVVVRGTVTNVSHRTWTAINVHGFMGASPITTGAELAAATKTPLTADVGHRITVPGTFASISSLAPGQTATFEVRLRHSTLPVSAAGVYWFGVHVLGDDGTGGAREAVGRDRTFLAYLPGSAVPAGRQETAALVVPVRAGVVRAPDGTVLDPQEWGRSLRSGELHEAAATGAAARGRPLTWLLDPAVTGVVRRLAHGNPARTLTTPAEDDGDDDSPSPSATSSAAGATTSTSGTPGTTPSAQTRRLARRWLARMHAHVTGSSAQVLGLPFGDLAVEPAVNHDPSLVRTAFRRTSQALRAWGVSATAAVSPPAGRTTPAALAGLPAGTEVLLDDIAVSGAPHTVNRIGRHPVLLASTATEQGGPGPVDPHASLAFRQRVLAEAALRLLGDRQPLVVELPNSVQHRLRPSFFSGLDVPWLRLTTVAGAAATAAHPLAAAALRPPASGRPTLGAGLYRTAQVVLDDGDTLQSILTGKHVLRRRLFEEVAGNASYAAQQEPAIAEARMRVTADWVRGSLDAIDLAAPGSVTLASASGHFSVLVGNGLDVPVTVKVRAVSDSQVQITGGETVQLAPHERTSVLLSATTHQRGVHNVSLELTTTGGRLLGAQDGFPMRAEQVSGLIWVIIGAGVALLFAAIAIRLTRRIMRARAPHE